MKVEEVLIPEVRRQRYPSLELPTLVLIFERYREQVRARPRAGAAARGPASSGRQSGCHAQLRM